VVGLIAPESAERAELAALLGERGYEVAAAEPTVASVQRLVAAGAEALILDLASPDAMKFVRRHATQWRRLPLICLADRRRPNTGSEALRLGAADIVARPLRADDVQAALANVAELAGLPSDDAPNQASPIDTPSEGVFGTSPAMQDVLALVSRVAPSSCSVIIIGERGTGREMIARAIHARSPRRDGPFVKIAGAAAEPGDFAPLFETSDQGRMTLYLENLGELRTAAQAALELWLRPRRGRRAQPRAESDRLRVIASAQPRLFDLVDRRQVSRELVEALAVVRIDLAPLRQRPEDVPLLAMHFLQEAAREAKLPLKTFSRGALQLLRALPWRGNAAELKSLCERLTVLVPRGVVQLEDVLGNVRLDAPEGIGRPQETLRQARERFERDYIATVVQQNRGRIGAAAKQLGIERTNLYRKLKQLNIPV
jgi:DNA-binding NtrC family response regulator